MATFEQGKPTLYEADTNPSARIGADLLDIRGKVIAIAVLSEEDGETVLGTIGDETAVGNLVGTVLESPVDQGRQDHQGPRYFLGFRLADRTAVVRAFWLESGELLPGGHDGPHISPVCFQGNTERSTCWRRRTKDPGSPSHWPPGWV